MAAADKAAAHVDREAWTVKFPPVVVPEFTDKHLDSAVKIVGVSDDLDLVAGLRKSGAGSFGQTGIRGAVAALLSRCY
jgi:hypothetical protein